MILKQEMKLQDWFRVWQSNLSEISVSDETNDLCLLFTYSQHERLKLSYKFKMLTDLQIFNYAQLVICGHF